MTTIVNPPGSGSVSVSSDSSGLGLVLGVVLAIAVIGLFVIFGLPVVRGTQESTQNDTLDVNLKLPSVTPDASTQQ